MKLLCKLGLHKWSKKKFRYLVSSNVKDFSRHCIKCGKRQTWVQTIDKKSTFRGE